MKDALTRNLLERAFKKKVQDVLERCASYAHRVYDDAFKKDLEKINSQPEGWLPTDDGIMVQIGAEIKQLRFKGTLDNWGVGVPFGKAGGRDLEDNKFRRFPAHKKGQVIKIYEATHPLALEYDQLNHEWMALSQQISEASRTARGAMDQVSTVKKLIDVWPEVEEFAKHYLEDGERKAILPAIPREQLNNLLDLPPETRP